LRRVEKLGKAVGETESFRQQIYKENFDRNVTRRNTQIVSSDLVYAKKFVTDRRGTVLTWRKPS
jgi:hypothetical protein